jgi:hypothetical protein
MISEFLGEARALYLDLILILGMVKLRENQKNCEYDAPEIPEMPHLGEFEKIDL